MSETQEQHTNRDWVSSCPACGERFIEKNTFEVDKAINQHLFLSCEKATEVQVENAAKWLTASNRRALASSLEQKAREYLRKSWGHSENATVALSMNFSEVAHFMASFAREIVEQAIKVTQESVMCSSNPAHHQIAKSITQAIREAFDGKEEKNHG